MKGEIVQVERALADVDTLTMEARLLDIQLKEAVANIKQNISVLGKLVCRMKDQNLWKYLIDSSTQKSFSNWESYARVALGGISHTKLSELALIGSLTEGPDALPEETVDAIGHKRAVALAKVPASERKRLVKSALESDPEQFATDIQDAINKGKPLAEQKEPTILFARNYPVSLVVRFKELEARALYMEQFHDADKSISAEAKFLYALIIFFESGMAEELHAADKRRKAAEKKQLHA